IPACDEVAPREPLVRFLGELFDLIDRPARHPRHAPALAEVSIARVGPSGLEADNDGTALARGPKARRLERAKELAGPGDDVVGGEDHHDGLGVAAED